MKQTDYQTVSNCKYTVDVIYSRSYGSSVSRIAKNYAEARFAWGEMPRGEFVCVFGFNDACKAVECKKAIENAFRGRPDEVKVGEIRDTYMMKVAAEISMIEREQV